MIEISSSIVQVFLICNSYIFSIEEAPSITIWLTVISISKISGFESMFVITLGEELDGGSKLVVNDELSLSTLGNFANEKPIDGTIEVSVTGTMIGEKLLVKEMGGSRLLQSEVDVIYAWWNKLVWRKGLLLNDNKRKNKKVYPSTVSLLAQL